MKASARGHLAAVEALLALPDIDVNRKDEANETAIMWAAHNGRLDIMKVIRNKISQ